MSISTSQAGFFIRLFVGVFLRGFSFVCVLKYLHLKPNHSNHITDAYCLHGKLLSFYIGLL